LSTDLQPRPAIWKPWLAALLWLGLIAFESTNALSAAKTSRILYPLLHFLLGLDPIRFLTWHFFLRKTGHVIGYAILSLLFYRAWRATILVPGNPRWSIVWARIAFAMTALVASLDEWHQTFLPSRTGTIWDVVLDSSAALVAQIIVFVWLRRARNAPDKEGNDMPEANYPEPPSRRSSTPATD
jgi:VanZ family protein